MENIDVKTIIDGGMTGVLVLVLVLNFIKDKAYNKTLNNHLSHVDKSLNELAKQQEIANSYHTDIVSALDRNTRMFGQISGAIDRCDRK